MSDFQTFIDAIQAYCKKETIIFDPKGKRPEAHFIPLLDFYKAFDLFRANHNLLETVGVIHLLNSVDDVMNIENSSGRIQEQWSKIIQDLSTLVIQLFQTGEAIDDNNHPIKHL